MNLAPAAQPGDPVAAIDTPALVVDLDAMERNLARMADWARQQGVRLRPHAKMHKCAEIARRQIAAGAVGVCVQKLDEAQALADAGIGDLYISNEVIAPAKLARLATLAQRVRLAVAVDSLEGVQGLASALRGRSVTVEVFVEVDVGGGRCGVPPEDAAWLARMVHQHHDDGLRLAGLQAYHGRAQHLRSVAERQAAARQTVARAAQARDALRDAGLPCPLVTGGGTGSFEIESTSGVYGEIQPGSYLFMDRDYADNDPAPGRPAFEAALFVKARVISRRPGQAVIDAGHKSHALDSGPPRVWGQPLDYVNGGDEHGILRSSDDEVLPALGDVVWLQPGHCDPTVNLHDQLIVVRGGLAHGSVEAVWPVTARGALR